MYNIYRIFRNLPKHDSWSMVNDRCSRNIQEFQGRACKNCHFSSLSEGGCFVLEGVDSTLIVFWPCNSMSALSPCVFAGPGNDPTQNATRPLQNCQKSLKMRKFSLIIAKTGPRDGSGEHVLPEVIKAAQCRIISHFSSFSSK